MSKRQLRSTAAAAVAISTQAVAAAAQPSQSNKRQLRSATKGVDSAEEVEFAELEDSRPAKKRKPAPVYQCFGCDEELPGRKFPKYNPTGECEHLINFCTDCLRQWVEAQIESVQFTPCGDGGKLIGVACPLCPKLMLRRDVHTASRKAHPRFVELERKHFANMTPNWRWCLAANCKEGQVHESTVPPNPKKRDKNAEPDAQELERMADICICNKCGAKACVPCDRPYHYGELCADYQLRIKDRVEEEDKSIATIQKEARCCPNLSCNKRIEKSGGCKHMHCSQCNSNFCWSCMKLLPSGGYQICECGGR